MKKLVESRQELEQNGVKVILVNAGEREEAKIKKMVETLGATVFPVVLDPYKRLSEGIGLIKEGENIALPMTLVVDNAAKPVFMIGQEGSDWPSVLWTK
jgi:alkyl hydroperoxide reductase subunit AhpC